MRRSATSPVPMDLLSTGLVPSPGPVLASARRPRRQAGRRTLPALPFRLSDLDAVRVSGIAFIVVTLTAVHQYLGPLRYTRPALTLNILLAALILLKPRNVRWGNLREAWPFLWLCAYAFCMVGSAIFGLSLASSLFYLLNTYWKIFLFFLVLAVAVRHVRDLGMLVWGYVIANGTFVVLSLTVLDVKTTHDGLQRMQGAGGLDGNDVGMVMLMGLPLAVLTAFNSGRVGRWASIAVILTTPITIALTGSRGALIGLGVVAACMLVALRRISILTRAGGTIAGVLVLALSAPEGYWKQMETIFATKTDYNYATEYGRIAIAKRGVGYMLRYPAFGVGIANFPRAEGTISPIAESRIRRGMSVEWIAPHNTYVQVGAELGAPALALWFGMLGAGTVGLLLLRRKTPASWDQESGERRFLRDMLLFLPMSYLAFAVTSFFLSHGYSSPVHILLAYTAGVVALTRRELAASPLPRRGAAPSPASTRRGWRGQADRS